MLWCHNGMLSNQIESVDEFCITAVVVIVVTQTVSGQMFCCNTMMTFVVVAVVFFVVARCSCCCVLFVRLFFLADYWDFLSIQWNCLLNFNFLCQANLCSFTKKLIHFRLNSSIVFGFYFVVLFCLTFKQKSRQLQSFHTRFGLYWSSLWTLTPLLAKIFILWKRAKNKNYFMLF